MHQFTLDKLQQDAEYELALQQDIEREANEKMSDNDKVFDDDTNKEDINKEDTDEEDTDKDESQLSISQLRAARLEYFESQNATTNESTTKKATTKRCTTLTATGNRCKNRADVRPGMPGDICYIHYKKNIR